MSGQRTKIVYLEILRIIAIFLVLFNHTETAGIHHYLETENPVNYWFGICAASAAQLCIPLFFMISGALLLRREESLRYVLRHRVLRMVIVLALAVLLQTVWNCKQNPEALSIKTYLCNLYTGTASVPHWFLYAYILMLLVLPLLQRLARVIPRKTWFLYLLVLWETANSVLPIVEYYTGLANPQFTPSVLGKCVVWGLMGYFVENRSEEMFYDKKNIVILSGASLILLAVSVHINYLSLREADYIAYGGLFVSVYALTVFVAVRYVCSRLKMPAALESFFCFVGSGVFGTYLIETQLREIFYPVFQAAAPRIHAYPAVLLWLGACVITGVLLSNLFKKIPLVGRLI